MKKALLVWGGWEGHEPQGCTLAAEAILKESGYETQVHDSVACYDDKALLQSQDLIVQCVTMSQISPEQEKNLCETIRSGVGLAGWHGGLCDSFRAATEYQFMTGGQWVKHPGNAQVTYTVNIVKPKDFIVADIDDFDYTSEQYYMHVDPAVEVLATTTFSGQYEGIDWIEGVVMPVVWKKPWGDGKVFYCSLGHVAAEFERPQLREIMKHGMMWATR